ncbi:phosphoglycerate dehydrogenase [Tenacibaculum finnmarkense genomovar finnmarkense]|uniref:phosphoglycerate dehydrogenase n=1 Tax=Tenacibaculum finnmarkense TaxID=2781243 RepID=UPI001E3638A4|nr:phosphoglycerate dehydrogenase [Tenacibaculum finnmarkense]MCD8418225.1 phosphoglycerate dehydrogenase [Tenacibaculum finnmarkense genomovar finnmarkense]MCG8186629.1 phosphoglycerate dehydrogenase [Tenacibaculum finnmarkense genomovar finnmarkense]MCG8203166.1 phosphoglycerate dehydrogenase [Tenacibaculum finnmarkense genomovar finnmarkense]MCG8210406.1 phosphoglycerate dehydrogenase [Tenacibaculum finnmarkense genomovar finnmarkense]MCG8213397.1 phosphoglycerate dehydrogenase [Tenacibacul
MTPKRSFVFDFDSTLTKVEALDVLAEISLLGNPKKEAIINQIITITNQGIDGEISFTESLKKRIDLLNATKADLPLLIKELEQKVSRSIADNKDFFKEFSDDIYVISAGFKEFIIPIVAEYNIPAERVFANTFEFDKNDAIIGFDTQNLLSQHNGKIDCLKNLNLAGEIQVIGDGYSDAVTKKAGVADTFFAYTENVQRAKTIANADHITPNLDEFLYLNDLPRNISYPKNRIKILLLENVHNDAFTNLTADGFSVETVSKSLSEEELIDKLKDVHVLGIRSKTQVTKKVIESADKLMVVSAFCIGTKQINLEACKENGVVVFNAPYSNTRSVVELAIGEIIMLMRSVFQRSTELHNGQWNKTAQGSREIRGKKLGIVGYGNIGKQLSVLAEALGMDVYYYDVEDKLALGNASKINTLKELLNIADVITLHVDDNAANKNYIGEKEIAQMKDGVHFVNLSRGFVVDIKALVAGLKSGKIAGAAVDVYPEEPRKNGDFYTELKGLPNVILTPHVGGSTEEAQKDIADFVPSKIMAYMNSGNTVDAVNFPNIRLPRQNNAHRFLHIHKNVLGVMAKINKVLAKYDLNITGQYLSTDEKVGYVITDVNKIYDKKVIEKLQEIDGTIKFRILY